jgi:N-methylhydantoinase A
LASVSRPSELSGADFVIATDVGGTCTDTVIFSPQRAVVLGKVFSTPPNFATGVVDSIRSAAAEINLDLCSLLRRTRLFIHGSTVVDNTILTREGAPTGLITTEGFEDTILMTRGAYGRWGGLTEEKLKHPVHTDRSPPLVAPDCIVGVPERVDYKGAILWDLNEDVAEQALRHLVFAKNVKAIAVSLLWSFYEPKHERAIRQLLQEIAPEVFCSLSSDVAPFQGEYERTSTTVMNAYAGRVAHAYLTSLSCLLTESGYKGPVMVMQGYGGLLPLEACKDRAIGLLECGPAAGVIGSRALGAVVEQPDIIATDMGGTTFKVSVIQGGQIEYAREPMVDRLHYLQPKIEVVSIGAGGGSIISLEPGTNLPRVGPASAGALPGPICYGRGGVEPTLTDVFLLAGYMDPANFLGGSVRLDEAAARRIFDEKIARHLGMSVEDATAGIIRVAAAQISDLIHEITVERGLDPREFVLHAFGGSCGMLAGLFAAELGVRRFVVPYTAAVNCAFGMISADIVHEYTTTKLMRLPADAAAISAIYKPMIEAARSQLAAEGFAADEIVFEAAVDLRYRQQVHEVTTPLKSPEQLDDDSIEQLIADFETLYQRRFGKGSAYREAGMEMTLFRLSAKGLLERPKLVSEPSGPADASAARNGRRRAFIAAQGMSSVDVYDFTLLCPGHMIQGPAIINTPITTVVLQSRQVGSVDGYRNLTIDLV